MKLEALIQNMTDQIKEAQLKLGYARETMRLYYPLSSLNAMLEMQETDIRELAKKIRHDLEAKKEKMGDTQIRIHADRIVFTIPPDFVEYVHEQVPEPPFLKELIQLFREKHACTKEEITAVFECRTAWILIMSFILQTAASMHMITASVRRWGTRFTTDLHGLILRH